MNITYESDFSSDLSFHFIPGVFYCKKIGKLDVVKLTSILWFVHFCLRVLPCLKGIK